MILQFSFEILVLLLLLPGIGLLVDILQFSSEILTVFFAFRPRRLLILL
jgi:hypothetical protein